MTEPGDATGRQHEKTPNTRRAPRFFSGSATAAVVAREQKRRGRMPPASGAWTTAIGFAGGQRRPKKSGAPAAGGKARALARVWEVERVVGGFGACYCVGREGKRHVLHRGQASNH